MKLLDCTLRDGGYYTNWDFNEKLVEDYAEAMESLPIEYVEVGYRSIKLSGYLGKYFYCPLFVLEKLKRLMPSKKLVVILNEKDINKEHLHDLLKPISSYVDLIRIAVDPVNFKRGIGLARSIKKFGFEVAFNVMYMSKWKENSSFLDLLDGTENIIDYFYMVDSFGGILPKELEEIITLVKSKTNITLGFHGHDNLQMALINTITALDLGCEMVDCTVTGMGRGAGNLKTELFLTYLESKGNLALDFRSLSKVVSIFEELKKEHAWGTSLPYMFSGAHSLPQKQVMEWVGLNRYSMSSIIHALDNKKNIVKDNMKFPILDKKENFKSAVILGGGDSVQLHNEAIKKYLNNSRDTCLIHAGVKNIKEYANINCRQFYTLVGVEKDEVLNKINITTMSTCVFPPFPRKMGVSIPKKIKDISKELEEISFTESSSDSPFAIAIQCALDLNVSKIYLVGFDGYDITLNKYQFFLAQENQNIIDDLLVNVNISFCSLTSTKYKNIEIASIYSLI